MKESEDGSSSVSVSSLEESKENTEPNEESMDEPQETKVEKSEEELEQVSIPSCLNCSRGFMIEIWCAVYVSSVQ